MSERVSVFDRRDREVSTRGCPICGAKSSVRLNLAIQKRGGDGKAGQSVGRSVSLCDEHGEGLYLLLETDIEEARRGGMRS